LLRLGDSRCRSPLLVFKLPRLLFNLYFRRSGPPLQLSRPSAGLKEQANGNYDRGEGDSNGK
jgi:hypothetical protein